MSKKLLRLVKMREQKFFNLAISGGETARRIFEVWRGDFAEKIDWHAVRFFWVDERVADENSWESNFFNANEMFFKPLGISPDMVFKIDASSGAETGAKKYSALLKKIFAKDKFCGEIFFDCTILGAGADGHVGSVFAENFDRLYAAGDLYTASENPRTRQPRITMTPRAMLNSREILMPILGAEKRGLLRRIFCEITVGTPAMPVSRVIKNAAQIAVFSGSA